MIHYASLQSGVWVQVVQSINHSKHAGAPEAKNVCNDMHSGIFGIFHHEASFKAPSDQVQFN